MDKILGRIASINKLDKIMLNVFFSSILLIVYRLMREWAAISSQSQKDNNYKILRFKQYFSEII